MSKIVLGEALRALLARNEALIVAYREGARNLPPGPVPNLAGSMVQQRRDLAKALTALAASPASYAEIDVDSDPRSSEAPTPGGAKDVIGLLGLMKEAEDADFERLTELAGSALPVSADAADLFASEANGAKKRASWAQDHLDLMSLAKP